MRVSLHYTSLRGDRKKYNFNTNFKSDELIYCNLSDRTGISFTTIPYNSNNIGNGQYETIVDTNYSNPDQWANPEGYAAIEN